MASLVIAPVLNYIRKTGAKAALVTHSIIRRKQMNQHRQFLVVLAMMFILLAACSPSARSSVPSGDTQPVVASTEAVFPDPTAAPAEAAAPLPFEITIDAADYSFNAPEIVRTGWVLVNLTNSGQEPHHVQFLRLNEGVRLEDFEAALRQGEGPALAMTQQVGGVGAIAPGVSAQAVINLPAGEYVVLCFIPSPGDGTPHHAKGMVKGLVVQESSGGTAAEPEADLVIRLKDFIFDMPANLPVGPMTIQVTNDGPEPHEWNIMRLEEGKDLQDALQFLTAPDGPPPFVPVGGMNGLDVGKTGYVEFDFQPGNYLAICNIPSPKAEGHPHFTLGMVKQFTVGSSETSMFPTGKFVSVNDGAISYEFNPEGAFGYFIGETKVVDGSYTTDGDLLTVVDPTETEPTCQGPASYHWSFDGEKLTFAPTGEDTCRPRRESFSDTYTMSD